MKKAISRTPAAERVSPELRAQLEAVAALPDDQITTGDPDAPEALDWSEAVRGKFYRPRKVQKTLRIDADVWAYFEAQGPGHLTRMNRAFSGLRCCTACGGGGMPRGVSASDREPPDQNAMPNRLLGDTHRRHTIRPAAKAPAPP